MQREHPALWRDLPPRAREAVHRRVVEQLPDIVREVTDEIGRNIDELLDVKLMVIRHLEANPELVNRVFLETGRKELKLIENFGFVFGFVLGIPVVFITEALPYWWVLPICGTVVGWVTNWVALWHDLRAGRAAADRTVHAARPVPAPPAARAAAYAA